MAPCSWSQVSRRLGQPGPGSRCESTILTDPGPGWPNRLETCDHEQGAMLFRYVGAREFPPIATRVVPFADL